MRRRWGEAYDWLADHLGPDALADFVARFGGRMMRVPVRVRESRQQRTARVMSELERGSYPDAAEAAGVCPATAFRLANDVPRDTCIRSDKGT